jgi:Ca-activated chloride channel family protein
MAGIAVALVAAIAMAMSACAANGQATATGTVQRGAVLGYAAEASEVDSYAFAETAKDSAGSGEVAPAPEEGRDPSGERYASVTDNPFFKATDRPYSTFAIDVDTASYANARSFIAYGGMPHPDSVRIEEWINYFPYEYEPPRDGTPFAVRVDRAACPWAEGHELVRVSIKGREMDAGQAPPSNLVFLIDTSGSMGAENKLPLLKEAFKLLVERLRSVDRVSIVAYAGSAGLVLDATPGNDRQTIIAALDRLESGGSTAGGAGLALAYQVAGRNLMRGGNNRIIIATDGDFNVGPSSVADMERLVTEGAAKGIFITVLGFGIGNYRDDMAEVIADKGNGNYAYIDGMPEARKVFGHDLTGTLFTIAKDVKVQVQFDPAQVAAYRLIGYENRVLATEDFDDDRKDAGELGAGHSVTALYQIVPIGRTVETAEVEPEAAKEPMPAGTPCVVRLRYKLPDGDTSMLIEGLAAPSATGFAAADADFRFAASVAGAGMLARESKWKGSLTWNWVIQTAAGSLGADPWGYRREFLDLVRKAASMAK